MLSLAHSIREGSALKTDSQLSTSSPLLSEGTEKNRSSKQKFPPTSSKSQLTEHTVALSTYGWFRGLQKQALSTRNVLSPTNVWMPPDQIHHRLTAND